MGSNHTVADVTSPGELPLGERLYAQGWRQGSLFTERSIRFLSNELGTDGNMIGRPRPTKAKEKFILISQECDIVSEDEPYVEALVCRVAKNVSHIGMNSSRWFVVDPEENLVATAYYRVQIDKTVLGGFSPERWPSTDERHQQLVRWLGRRYMRPAISPGLVNAFQNPVVRTLRAVKNAMPQTYDAFNRAVHELRITIPDGDNSPYQLGIMLLLADELSEEEANSVDIVMNAIRADLDSDLVTIASQRRVTRDEISVREYNQTIWLPLDSITYLGDEQEGAESFWSG